MLQQAFAWMRNDPLPTHSLGKVIFGEGQDRPLGDTTKPQISKSNSIYLAGKKFHLSSSFSVVDKNY